MSPPQPEAETPEDSSARITHPPAQANFSPPVADKLEPTDSPPVAVRLPDIPDIKWEWKEQGTVCEAWHCPSGQRNRENSRYLGRLGKRKLQQWVGKPDDFHPEIRAWLEQKKAEKGIG